MKAAIFDLDNTLLDSDRLWRALPALLLKEYHHKQAESDLFKQVADKSLPEAVEYIGKRYDLNTDTKILLDQCLAIITDAYLNRLPLFPYALDVLREMKENQVRLCVATASPRNLAVGALGRCGATDYLDFILTEEEVGKSKRDPAIYLQAAQRMNVPPEECAVFEDAPHAIKTALNAGFPVYEVKIGGQCSHLPQICRTITSYQELLGGKLCTLL